MITPKVNICSPFVGKTQISPTRYLFIHRASERHKSWKKRTNFTLLRPPGSSYNTLMDKEYSAGRSSSCSNLALNRTLIHCRTTIYCKFQGIPASKPNIQYPLAQNIFWTPKFKPHPIINLQSQP